jgi:hypothetical protein
VVVVVVVLVLVLVLVVVVVVGATVVVVVVVVNSGQYTLALTIPPMEAVLVLQGVSGGQSIGDDSMNIKSVYDVPARIT